MAEVIYDPRARGGPPDRARAHKHTYATARPRCASPQQGYTNCEAESDTNQRHENRSSSPVHNGTHEVPTVAPIAPAIGTPHDVLPRHRTQTHSVLQPLPTNRPFSARPAAAGYAHHAARRRLHDTHMGELDERIRSLREVGRCSHECRGAHTCTLSSMHACGQHGPCTHAGMAHPHVKCMQALESRQTGREHAFTGIAWSKVGRFVGCVRIILTSPVETLDASNFQFTPACPSTPRAITTTSIREPSYLTAKEHTCMAFQDSTRHA